MNTTNKQLGLTNAARAGWQSYASYSEDVGVRLCQIPAHMAFDRIDVLATNSGEPMT
jgi:hypothetical protein